MNIYWSQNGYRCDSAGSNILNNEPPRIYYGEQPTWNVTILTGSGAAADLTGIASFRAAIDKDLSTSTTPMCRTLSSGISVSDNVISVEINARTAEFLAAVNGKSSVSAYFELWGFDSGAAPVFYLRIPIIASAVVDPDGGEPPEVQTGYITEAAVRALIAGITPTFQYSADGSTSWHSSYTSGDRFQRMSVNSGAQWSAAYPIGRSGVIVDNVNYSFTTTAGQAAAITFTKAALGIAADSEPQLSLWSVVVVDTIGSAQSGGENPQTSITEIVEKTQINTASYTAVWSSDSLTITYYTTWPAGNWIIKMS